MTRSYVTLPNILSVLRIILVIPILVAFHAEMFILTLVLFLVSAGSDALDGAIARKWKMESEFGRVLDPLADKITFVTLIIVFGWHVLAFLPLMVLIAGEIILLVMGGCTYFKPQWELGFTLGTNKYGKIKTGCEIILILLLIIWHFVNIPPAYLFSLYVMLTLCIIFALKSMIAHIHSRLLF